MCIALQQWHLFLLTAHMVASALIVTLCAWTALALACRICFWHQMILNLKDGFYQIIYIKMLYHPACRLCSRQGHLERKVTFQACLFKDIHHDASLPCSDMSSVFVGNHFQPPNLWAHPLCREAASASTNVLHNALEPY